VAVACGRGEAVGRGGLARRRAGVALGLGLAEGVGFDGRLAVTAGWLALMLGAREWVAAAAGWCPRAEAGAAAGQDVTANAAPAPRTSVLPLTMTVTAGARRRAE
jgi:hypothetical protein